MACNRWITVTTDSVVTVHTTPMSYDDINKAVGGWIEAVPTTGQVTIYCNEEGKLTGLPFNQIATAFVRPFIDDVIVGNVVFCGPPDEEGDETDVPWDVEAILTKAVQ
jgi:hypothetical protein